MNEESTPSADETSATAGASPTWHANGMNGTGGETPAGDADPTPAAVTEAEAELSAPDDNTAFLAELARAMKATVATERARLSHEADRRRETHIAAIHARRETEASRMRDLAQDDLKAIDSWAESERQRIQRERERRAAGVRLDLDSSLAEHATKIDRQVQAVDAAIATYRGEVEAFFQTLDVETDPVVIAQHASRRPVFPSLDDLGGESSNEPTEGAAEAETPAAPAEAAVAATVEPSAAVEPEPVAAQAEPGVAEVEPVVAQAEPVMAEATAAEPEPAAAEPEPAEAVAAEAIAEESTAQEPVVAEATPTAPDESTPAAEPEPVVEPKSTAPMIGVMDSTKPATKLAQAWAAWMASTEAADEARRIEEAAQAETDKAKAEAEEAANAAVVAAGSYKPASETSSRSTGGPMGWLRRDKDHSGS